jgi:AcrR family transcriptional regulator
MPPVRNAAATRERLLGCAHKRFLNESYENVGLRDIAGDAGVDVALVGRYFGSKEQLFKDVLHKRGGDWHSLAARAEDIPWFLADLAVSKEISTNTEHIERLLIMLRSASSPQASALVRASFGEDVLGPLASLLSGRNAQIRAAVGLSVLVGTTIMRTMMSLNAIQECDHAIFRERLAAVLTAAFAVTPPPEFRRSVRRGEKRGQERRSLAGTLPPRPKLCG